jgi:predicted transcriptional regulator of viral defense system
MYIIRVKVAGGIGMRINEVIALMQDNQGIISTAQLVEQGIDKKYLTRMVKEGIIERSSRGVYILPEVLADDFYAIGSRCRKGIFSHETALFFHDLSDRTPFTFSITLPKGYNPASLHSLHLEFFYVKPELLDMGRITMLSPYGKEISTYDMERTICDIVRSKHRMDIQIFTDALKRYPKRKDKDLSKLMKYAEAFKVSAKIREYMEVLI